jgi:uncharacterized membrane protein
MTDPVSPEQIEAQRSNDRRKRAFNTSRAFRAIKAQHAENRTLTEILASRLTDFASSTVFLLIHIVWFSVWILWNAGTLGLEPFDPFPFGLLTLVVSLEAIFLSIFLLLGQRRESGIAELREEVTLQVTLRVEEEVTKSLQLMAGLYSRLGYKIGEDPELQAMLTPLDAASIEAELDKQIKESVASTLRRK